MFNVCSNVYIYRIYMRICADWRVRLQDQTRIYLWSIFLVCVFGMVRTVLRIIVFFCILLRYDTFELKKYSFKKMVYVFILHIRSYVHVVNIIQNEYIEIVYRYTICF